VGKSSCVCVDFIPALNSQETWTGKVHVMCGTCTGSAHVYVHVVIKYNYVIYKKNIQIYIIYIHQSTWVHVPVVQSSPSLVVFAFYELGG
jgi:hypothetical protein